MRALRSRFMVGVYPVTEDPEPVQLRFRHIEGGDYLSRKYRICTWKSAAEFSTPHDARDFFHAYKRHNAYKLHIVEYKTLVEVPAPVLAADNPHAILERIRCSESPYVRQTAFFWYMGRDISNYWTSRTLAKHRMILLAYGLDIFLPPDRLLEPFPSQDDHVWHLARQPLTAVK